MKKFSILILFLNTVFIGNAQKDTLQQQLRIEQNISKYVGKPVSILYNDLTIKPKTVEGFLDSKNIFVEWAHKFFYEVPDSITDTYIYIYIYIEFQEPLLKSETQKHQHRYDRYFNSQEYPTYADKKIKNLQLFYAKQRK